MAERPTSEERTVEGTVTSASGDVAPGLDVQIVVKEFRQTRAVAHARTDAHGRYVVRWCREELACKSAVFVRVVDGKVVAAQSPPNFDPPVHQVLDFVVDVRHVHGPSEYERLQSAIAACTRETRLGDLSQDDVDFLAGSTGEGVDQLTHLVVAARLSATSKIDGAFFYAILRQRTLLGTGTSSFALRNTIDLTTPTESLYYDIVLAPPDRLRAAVTTSIAQRQVPERVADELDGVFATLGQSTAAAQGSVQQRPKQILDAVAANVTAGKLPEIWNVLANQKGFGDPNAFAKAISSITLVPPGGDGGPGSPLTAALASTPQLLGDLQTLLNPQANKASHAFDAATLSGTPAQARRTEQRHPTASFVAQLAAAHGVAVPPNRDAIVQVLTANPTFDLGRDNVDLLLKKQPLPAGTDAKTLRNELQAIQRVFKLAPTFRQTTAVLGAGIQSAAQVVAMGRTQFVKRFTADKTFSPDEANTLFRRASDVATGAAMLAGELRSISGAATTAAIAPPGVAEKLSLVSQRNPNLKNLFKLIDQCECVDCRSVTSPAAYLVDVLQFLKARTVTDTTGGSASPNQKAKDVLWNRRRDLGDIDLSCDNTNVPLPYIDVVCELLEEAVSQDPGFAFTGAIAAGPASPALVAALQVQGLAFTSAAYVQPADSAGNFYVRDTKAVCKLEGTSTNWTVFQLRQTFRSAAELAAAPEYVNTAAYTILQSSQIAFHLPYDLFFAESRAYFSQFGIGRDELMRALVVGASPAPADLAADFLGFSDGERAIVGNQSDAANQGVYWNTGATDPATVVNNVDTFLARTGLKYTDLQNLLRRKFINPNDTIFIQWPAPVSGLTTIPGDLGCDTSQQILAGLDDGALDRIHRFLRVTKRLGWDMVTLDRGIMAPRLGATKLTDDPFLMRVADLLRLRDRLKLSLDELIIFYDVIPTDGDPSRYAQIFLNPTANGTVDPLLQIASVQANPGLTPPATPLRLGEVTSLPLALGISAADLTLLIGALAGNDVLSFTSLATVYSWVSLARLLGLPIAEFVTLLSLSKIDPLASPADTLRFVAVADAVRTAGLKPDDLEFLLSFPAADSARALSDATVLAILTTLQSALQVAFTASVSPFDATLTADENKAAVRALVGKLPNVGATQLGRLDAIIDDTYAGPVPASSFLDALLKTPFGIDTTKIDALQATLAGTPAQPPGPFETARKNLIQQLLADVSYYLYESARPAIVIATVAAAVNVDPALADVLSHHAHRQIGGKATVLVDVLGDDKLIDKQHSPPVLPAIDPINFSDQYAAVRQVRQMALFATKQLLSNDDVTWLLDNAAALGWLALDALPEKPGAATVSLGSWLQLQDAIALFKRYQPVVNPDNAGGPFSLRDVFFMATISGTAPADLLDRLALVTGWDRGTLGDLDAWFAFSSGGLTPYRLPATLLKLETAATLLRRLGISRKTATDHLIQPKLDQSASTALRQALKARYSESDWLGVLKQIYDPLRQQKRDALVAWLLANNPGFTDSDDLFDYFLIDVEMCACQPTSRIVSAHGTLQLFVQRCLLGVEPKAVADTSIDDGWKQWSWMANYRVWQANRQVFLYPENWIDPTLRDDKSELYVAFENSIQQSSLTDDSITNATIAYLEQLDDIAFLEVMTSYYELRTFTLHVFARTKGGDPPTYYYRKLENESWWTPWQKVDLDIKGNHLVAFTRNGRLHLAWPIFTEKANREQVVTIPKPSDGGSEAPRTQRKYDITLAVSELTNEGKWTASRTSQDPMPWTLPWFEKDLPDPDEFRFLAMDLRTNGFSISCALNKDIQSSNDMVLTAGTFIGGFSLTGCKGYPEPLQKIEPQDYLFFPLFLNAPTLYERNFMQTGNDGKPMPGGLQIMTATLLQWVQILGNTPDFFRVAHPQQVAQIDYLMWPFIAFIQALVSSIFGQVVVQQEFPLGTFMPYFFEDGSHNYMLLPALYVPPPIEGPPISPLRVTYKDVQQLFRRFVDLTEALIVAVMANPSQAQQLLAQYEHDVTPIMNEALLWQTSAQYRIEMYNFYHPLVCPLRKTLYSDGVPKLLARDTQTQVNTNFKFQDYYAPNTSLVPPVPFGDPNASYPVEDIDFSPTSGYGDYNWELFFHAPFEIAVKLSQDHQFEKALQWFHYIFDPTDASSNSAPQKYWQTKPFFLTSDKDYFNERIDNIMGTLAADPTGNSAPALAQAVADWRKNPFDPFVVARSRTVAFQQAVVMKYLDNLIAWGDSLFAQDTMESVNQATQLYVLADRLLGPKPRIVPPLIMPPPETYNQLDGAIDLFGNELENLLPELPLLPHGGTEVSPTPMTLSSLYFCIPPNTQLLGYWDKVADRLFKIRHCQDLNGVERTLALFAPPIDPGALVRAMAGGLSLSEVLAGLNAPLPFYRFSTMAQKATELTQVLISLGDAMLQALEKRDVAALERLRATEELALLNAQRITKEQQLADANEQLQVLQRSIDVTTEKSQYYHSLVDKGLSASEILAMNLSLSALDAQKAVVPLDQATAVMHLVPSFSVGLNGFGGSPAANISFGGENIAGTMAGFAAVQREQAGFTQSSAQITTTLAQFERRNDEWKFQATLADKELAQLAEQVVQAKIKVAIAEADLAGHLQAVSNAKQTDQFLRGKFTSRELYDYILGQLSNVYFRSYKMALDVAHKAERCYQLELGVDQTFVQYDYWDNLKKGLLSGHRLLADLKQLELAYLDQNRREYEITKHVSLAQLDPYALLQLKSGGSCTFSVPEASFDLDHPGQYFRRLKTVAITVPCVTGPYSSVSCKLSLVGNRYRRTTSLTTSAGTGYAEDPGNDERFEYSVGSIQSIATSQGQNDSGLFEVNFHDDRYLPFEGQGALSSWRLELPSTIPQFDYGTITDVVIHLRYTARDGGSTLRGVVEKQLASALQAMTVDAQRNGLYQAFDFARELPDQFYQLRQTGSAAITIPSARLPLFTRGRGPKIAAARWLAVIGGSPSSYSMSVATPIGQPAQSFMLGPDADLKNMLSADSPSLNFDTGFTLGATNPSALQQLVLFVHYTLS